MNNVEMESVGIIDHDDDDSDEDNSHEDDSVSDGQVDSNSKVENAIGFALLFMLSGSIVLLIGLAYAV